MEGCISDHELPNVTDRVSACRDQFCRGQLHMQGPFWRPDGLPHGGLSCHEAGAPHIPGLKS